MSAADKAADFSLFGVGGGVFSDGAKVVNSICFGSVDGTILSTYTPGRCIALGDKEPIGTICSALCTS